jgi:hypothetical protein
MSQWSLPIQAMRRRACGSVAIRRLALFQARQRRRLIDRSHVGRVVPVPRLRLLNLHSVRFGDHDAAGGLAS